MKGKSATTMLNQSAPKPDVHTSGLACPRCGCRHLPVYYTRPQGNGIIRSRQCRHCGKRIITREKI